MTRDPDLPVVGPKRVLRPLKGIDLSALHGNSKNSEWVVIDEMTKITGGNDKWGREIDVKVKMDVTRGMQIQYTHEQREKFEEDLYSHAS